MVSYKLGLAEHASRRGTPLDFEVRLRDPDHLDEVITQPEAAPTQLLQECRHAGKEACVPRRLKDSHRADHRQSEAGSMAAGTTIVEDEPFRSTLLCQRDRFAFAWAEPRGQRLRGSCRTGFGYLQQSICDRAPDGGCAGRIRSTLRRLEEDGRWD